MPDIPAFHNLFNMSQSPGSLRFHISCPILQSTFGLALQFFDHAFEHFPDLRGDFRQFGIVDSLHRGHGIDG